MNKEDVIHLANLARIELSPAEIETFTEEMSAILDYVSQVKGIAGDFDQNSKTFGRLHNVFRKDEVTNDKEEYTKALLAEMPQTSGRFMVVKKILNIDSQ
jgi:aspartyl-tRNA(Asn)/glutamyl-tRNA(Gln) amidotransferase subunit C